MKSAIALAVLIFVCGAQARAVEDDVMERGMIKDKLKHFIGYLENQVQPSLHELDIKLLMLIRSTKFLIFATLEEVNFYGVVIERILKKKGAKELYEVAEKLNLDTSRCDQKINPVMEKFSAYHKDLEYCSQNTEPRYNFINDAQEAIEKLQNASLVIDGYAIKARKCVEDATLWSSVSAAKCLAESILAAESEWFKAPGYADFNNFYNRYQKLYDQIEDCAFRKRYAIIEGKANKTREEVNDCISQLVEASKKKENQSSGNSTRAQI